MDIVYSKLNSMGNIHGLNIEYRNIYCVFDYYNDCII